jgi:acyl carrier protein
VALDRPINELGVDSLMATEVQLLLESQLAIQVSVLELLNDATVRFITERALKSFDLEVEAPQEVPQPG